MTFNEYITEHESYDDLSMALYESKKVVTNASYQYTDNVRQADQRYIYESVDIDVLYEQAEDGFFAKIGSAVIKIIDKFRKFTHDIMEKVKQFTGIGTTEAAKAQKMMNQYPEYKDTIISGLESGQLTIRDVADLDKNIHSVIKLYEQNKLSEEEFNKKTESVFMQSVKKVTLVTGAIATVVGLVNQMPKFFKSVTEVKQSLAKSSDMMDNFKKDLDTKKYNEPKKATAIFRALSQLIGIKTKEYNERVTLVRKLSNRLADSNSKFGKKMAAKFDKMDNAKTTKDNQKIENNRKYMDKHPRVPDKNKTTPAQPGSTTATP